MSVRFILQNQFGKNKPFTEAISYQAEIIWSWQAGAPTPFPSKLVASIMIGDGQVR